MGNLFAHAESFINPNPHLPSFFYFLAIYNMIFMLYVFFSPSPHPS